MRFHFNTTLILAAILAALFSSTQLVAAPKSLQSGDRGGYQYLNPGPGDLVATGSMLTLRSGVSAAAFYRQVQQGIEVYGALSGRHEGELVLAADGLTVCFQPNREFEHDEKVEVTLPAWIDDRGEEHESVSWSFRTLRELTPGMLPGSERESAATRDVGTAIPVEPPAQQLLSAALPTPFPVPNIVIEGDTASGYLMGNASNFTTGHHYIMIMDHLGQIHYVHEVPGIRIYNLAWHPERQLFSYYLFDGADRRYQLLTRDFEEAGNLRIVGYPNATDNHELLLMGDGTHWIEAYHWLVFEPLADEFPDIEGDPILMGFVVQHQDQDSNVLFEWRSWDHVPLGETADWYAAIGGGNYYDHVHGNTIEIVSDSTLLLSFRYLDSVYKINSLTGDVIWKLGGEDNSFTQVNSFSWHNAQHDSRYHADTGLYTIFDNHHFLDDPNANGRAYRLDEDSMTVELVFEFDPGIREGSPSRGSFRQMHNGNWLIGWGEPGDRLENVTEVDSQGVQVWSASFKSSSSDPTMSYRWVPLDTMPEAARPSLSAEDIDGGIRLLLSHWGRQDITGYRIVAQTGDEQPLWTQDVTMNRVDLDTLRSGFRYRFHIISLGTSGDSDVSNAVGYLDGVDALQEGDAGLPERWLTLAAWPNPFNTEATIQLGTKGTGRLDVELYTTQGRLVHTLARQTVSAGQHRFTLNGAKLSSGVYLIRARIAGHEQVKRLTLLK